MEYRLRIKDLAGDPIATDIRPVSLRFSKALNSPGACEFVLPIDDQSATPSVLYPLSRRVEVRVDGTRRWAGDIWAVQANAGDATVRVSAQGYFARLRARQVAENLYYKGVEQFDIAWGLISYTQSRGDLGITRDPDETPSGVSKNRHYCAWEVASIGDAIEELAVGLNGFDFEVGPDLVWRVWYPRRGLTTPAKTFRLGPTSPNVVEEARVSIDAGDTANRLGGIPDEECLDEKGIIVVSAPTSIATYGLMEEAVAVSHLKFPSDREDFLKEELRVRKMPREQVWLTTLDMPWDSPGYEVGDDVLIDGGFGYLTYSSRQMRLLSWEVNVEEDAEWVRVLLDSSS